MKIYDIMKICKINLLRDKKNIYNILILSILISLIVFIFSLNKSFEKYYENGISKNISYRTLFVHNDTLNDTDSYFKDLKSIEHVVSVIKDTQYLTAPSFIKIGNKKKDGSFLLQGGTKETVPDVIMGKKMSTITDIICPINFYPKDNIDEITSVKKNEIINLSLYLNDYFLLRKKISIDNKELNQLKIVGLFENSTNFVDENTCYASPQLIEQINSNYFSDYEWSDQVDSVIVQVDSSENVEFVENELNKFHYSYLRAFIVDDTLFDSLHYGTYIITIIVLLSSIIIMLVYTRKKTNERIKEINLYRCLGYSNKEINVIVLFENFGMGLLSIFLSIFIIGFILLIIKIQLNVKPYALSKLPIEVNMFSYVISFIVVCIISVIGLFFNNKAAASNHIIEELKE